MTNTEDVPRTKSPYEIGDEVHREVINMAESIPPEEREPLPDEARGSWFCPCAEPRHEDLIRFLMERHDLERFYDLGAGDLRISAALADDYEVVAYELNALVANRAYTAHGEPDIELRTRDYYGHWPAMNHRDALYACIGKTNELPGTPKAGIGVEGVDDLRLVYGESMRDDYRE